jgi:nucleotide-binding universal stress UspA family protein
MTDTVGTNQAKVHDTNQPILVAVDFSDDSKAALAWAGKYVECSGARLILLHVVHDPVSNPGFYRNGKENSWEPMQTVAESMMADFLAHMKIEQPGLESLKSAELRFVPGLPPSRIVEVADLLNAGLIVVGSRGITGFPHILLGSVAERVVVLAKCPVVVVKAKGSTLTKKERKLEKKEQKKEKKRLKNLLNIDPEPETPAGADG